tara:strand:+ start:172 stop:519 length:348 start_codon:yes stop_codon:yes gene_type:complete
MNYQLLDTAYHIKTPQYLGYNENEKLDKVVHKDKEPNYYTSDIKKQETFSSWKYRKYMQDRSESIKKRDLRETKNNCGRYIPENNEYVLNRSDLQENYQVKVDLQSRKMAPNIVL